MENESTNNNVNHQVNGNRNGLIICLTIIIIILSALLIYFVFIKKDDEIAVNENENNVPAVDNQNNVEENNIDEKEENNQINEQEEEKQEENNPKVENTDTKTTEVKDKNTYTTADGKHTLTIKNKTFYYDNKKYGKDAYNEIDEYKTGKYSVLSANVGQCGNYFFVVNKDNNTLVDLNYFEDSDKSYSVKKIGNNYYFIEGGLCGFLGEYSFYTENMKKIGTAFLGKDNNDNFYVLENGKIIKYDKNAKIIISTKDTYYKQDNIEYNGENDTRPIITNDNMYFIYDDDAYTPTDSTDDIIKIVDVVNDKAYTIVKKSEYNVNPDGFKLNKNTNNIEITLNPYKCAEDGFCKIDDDTEVIYIYDIKNKTITKK